MFFLNLVGVLYPLEISKNTDFEFSIKRVSEPFLETPYKMAIALGSKFKNASRN